MYFYLKNQTKKKKKKKKKSRKTNIFIIVVYYNAEITREIIPRLIVAVVDMKSIRGSIDGETGVILGQSIEKWVQK